MNVQVATMMMLVLIGSLGLIAQGTVWLLGENKRTGVVREFNERVRRYNAETVPRLEGTRVTIDTHNALRMSLIAVPIEIEGSRDGVEMDPEPASFTLRATLNPISDIRVTAATDNGTGVQSAIDFGSLDVVAETVIGVECLRDWALTRCGSAMCCAPRDLQELCAMVAGELIGNYTEFDDVDSCRISDLCGICRFAGFITRRCEIMRWDAGAGWTAQEGNFSEGCRFPFVRETHVMEHEDPGTLTFELRAADDPFLWLSNETMGSMDFGTTESEQRKAGLVMLAAGSAVIIIIGVGIVSHYCNMMKYEKVIAERRKELAERQQKMRDQEGKMQELDEVEEGGTASGGAPPAAAGAAAPGASSRGGGGGNPLAAVAATAAAGNSRSSGVPQPQQQQQQQQHSCPSSPGGLVVPTPPPPPLAQGADRHAQRYHLESPHGPPRSPARAEPRYQQVRRDAHRDERSPSGGGGGRRGPRVIDMGASSASSTPAAYALAPSRGFARRHSGGHGGSGGSGSLRATPHDLALPQPRGRHQGGVAAGSSAGSTFSGHSVDLDSLPMPARTTATPHVVVARRVVTTKKGGGRAAPGAYDDGL